MQTFDLSHEYPVSVEQLWAFVTDYSCLKASMRNITEFIGLPDGVPCVGDVFDVTLRQVQGGHETPWQIRIVKLDDLAKTMATSEGGGPVMTYDHTFTVASDPLTTLHETLTIDAGPLTDAAVAHSRQMYLARHEERLRLLVGAS